MILIFLLKTVFALEAVISLTPDTVNTQSTMKLSIIFEESLGKGGIISVKIPAQKDETSENRHLSFLSSISSCFTDDKEMMIESCEAPNTSQLNIKMSSQSFVIAGSTITFTIQDGCINPSSLWYKDKSLQIDTANSANMLIERKNAFLTFQSLSPKPLQIAQIQSSDQMIGSSDNSLTISFKPMNDIPQTGSIQFDFPQRVETFQQSYQYINPDNYSIQSFSINGLSKVAGRYALKNQNGRQVLVLDYLPGKINAQQDVKITIKGYNNPIKFSFDGLIIKTFDNFGYQIDQSQTISLDVTQPAEISLAKVEIDSGQNLVNMNSGIKLEFQSPIPLSQGCLIKIKVPKSMQKNLYQNLKYIYAYGFFGALKSLPFAIEANQTLDEKYIVVEDACNTFVMNDLQGTIKIKYLQNPDSARQTEEFKIQILDLNKKLLVQTPDILNGDLKENLTLSQDSFAAQEFQIAQIIPQNQTAGETNDLLIQILLSNTLELSLKPKITLKVPEVFDLQESCSFETFSDPLIPLQGQVSCTVDRAQKIITINNIGKQNLGPSSSTMIFKLSKFMKNPLTKIEQIGNFVLSTWKNEQLVDQTTIQNGFIVNAGSLFDAQLTFLPSISSALNPKVNVQFVNQHQYVSGTLVSIFVHASNKEVMLHQGPISCHGDHVNALTCKAVLQEDAINYLITFEVLNSIPAFSKLMVTFENLFQTTPRFKGILSKPSTILTSISNLVIDETFPKVYSKVEISSSLEDVQLKFGKKENLAAMSSLDADIKMTVQPLDTDHALIDLSEDVKNQLLKGQIYCEYPHICSITGSVIKITGLSSTKQFSISVKGITNPISTRPIGPISFSIYDIQGRLVQEWPQKIFVSSSIAQETQKVRIMQSSTIPNSPSNYTFSIEKHYLESDIIPWVKLTLPDCLTFELGKLLEIYDTTKFENIKFTKYSQYDFVFQLHTGINFFTLLNIVNPTESCLWQSKRLSFEYRTYEDSKLQYAMEQKLTGLEPSLSCKSPCATCQIVDKNFCLSCSDPLTMLLIVDQGKCISSSTCPTGTFIKGNKCEKCSQGCKECSSFGVCQSCESNLLLKGSECVEQTQCSRSEGFIVLDNSHCQKCHSECKECGLLEESGSFKTTQTYSPQYCTVCQDTQKISFQGSCLNECPSNYQEFTTSDSLRICKSNEDLIKDAESLSSSSAFLRFFSGKGVYNFLRTTKIGYFFAQFPIFLVLFPFIHTPSRWCKKDQVEGDNEDEEDSREKLSNREYKILNFKDLEYLALWALLIKSFICLAAYHTKTGEIYAFDQFRSTKFLIYEQDGMPAIPDGFFSIKTLILLVFLLSFFYLAVHHLMNWYHFRRFDILWNLNIAEDFYDELHQERGNRYGLNIIRQMKYFNWLEWIHLWKCTGHVVPDDSQLLLQEQFVLQFTKLSLNYCTFNVFVKVNMLFIVMFLVIFAESNIINQSIKLQDIEFIEYKDIISGIKKTLFIALLELQIFSCLSILHLSHWIENKEYLGLFSRQEQELIIDKNIQARSVEKHDMPIEPHELEENGPQSSHSSQLSFDEDKQEEEVLPQTSTNSANGIDQAHVGISVNSQENEDTERKNSLEKSQKRKQKNRIEVHQNFANDSIVSSQGALQEGGQQSEISVSPQSSKVYVLTDQKKLKSIAENIDEDEDTKGLSTREIRYTVTSQNYMDII